MATTANFAKGQLKSFVERIEKLEEEKKALAEDVREVYAEAKGAGFDTKALRTVVKAAAPRGDKLVHLEIVG